jgi:serine/threonine protein phosphatase PrpC
MLGDPISGQAASAGRFRSAAATHPGTRRTQNEDAWLNRPDLGLWAVADGAGGHQAGAKAARAAVEALHAIPATLTGAELLAQVRLRLLGVHAALGRAAVAMGENAITASTIVALIARGAHFACIWAGDSRLYRTRDGRLEQVTRDHNLLQELLDSGEATAELHPERHVITRALGSGAQEPGLEKITGALLPGDRFLLCSDGINKTLQDDELATLLLERDATSAAEAIVRAALAREATDNLTAIAINVDATELSSSFRSPLARPGTTE